MKDANYTDKQLIEMILESGQQRSKALKYLYTSWRDIARSVLLKSGTEIADAEDAIQEAVIVLDNSIRNGSYENKGSMRNYFIGICKGRIYSNTRSTKRITWTDDHLKMDGIETQHPETLMLDEEQKSILDKVLTGLDTTCREVLKLYKLSYSMNEIAEQLNLGNANNVRQRVFKCRKKLIAFVMQNKKFTRYFNDAL